MNIHKEQPYKIYVPSIRPQFYSDIVNCLPEFEVEFFDGKPYNSCAKMMNDLIVACPTETIVVIHDKTRPKPQEIYQILDYVEQGYGMAWLWPYGFGGFKKDAIRKVGLYDERFSDGQYEDCDMIRRFKEADISLVMLHQSKRLSWPTLWKTTESAKFYTQKWGGPSEMTRLLPDEDMKYDLGPSQGTKFLPWSFSIVDAHPPATEAQNQAYRKVLDLE